MKTEVPESMESFCGAWAIDQRTLPLVQSALNSILAGDVPQRVIQSRKAQGFADKGQGFGMLNGVAILSLTGFMVKTPSIFSRFFGATSTAELSQMINAVADDPDVKGIVLYVDSPGGFVDGTEALSNAIFQARGRKPIIAVIDGTCASAAYWAASAADKVFITSRTAETGSIGVVAVHVDTSRAEDQRGVKITEITAGKYKRIASQHAPLSDEGTGVLQGYVDSIYNVFVSDVAKHRNTTTAAVKRDMADGRVFIGQDAITAGLVDGIMSLDSAISSLAAQASAIPARVSANTTKGTKKTESQLYQEFFARNMAAGMIKGVAMESALKEAQETKMREEQTERAAKQKTQPQPSAVTAPARAEQTTSDPIAEAQQIASEMGKLDSLLRDAGVRLTPAELSTVVQARRDGSASRYPWVIGHLATAERQRLKALNVNIGSAEAVERVTAALNQQ